MMQALRLTPYDVAYFRGGKAFARGTDHAAASVFPPYPATVYNAIRTALLNHAGAEMEAFARGDAPAAVRAAVGTPSEPGTLALHGVFPLGNEPAQWYFPVPQDLFYRGPADQRTWCALAIKQDDRVRLSAAGPAFLHYRDIHLEKQRGWMSARYLNTYLTAGTDFGQGKEFVGDDEMVARDSRVGIGIDPDRGTVNEGQFYVAEALAFRPGWSLGAMVNDPGILPPQTHLFLGGEGRLFHHLPTGFDPGMIVAIDRIKETVRKTGRFKIVYLTPALLNGGWLPGSTAINTECEMGARFRLLAAACNRPVRVSGYDMARNIPRPGRNLLPAGSVFCGELVENNAAAVDALFDYWHWRNTSDQEAQFGYGLTVIGGMNDGN